MSGNDYPCSAKQANSLAIRRMRLLGTDENADNQQPTCVNTNNTVAALATPPPKGEKPPKDIAAKAVKVKPSNGHDTPRSETPKAPSHVKNENSSLRQQRENALLVFGLVTIVAVGILFLLVFAYLGFVTFSSLVTSPGFTQQENRTGVSETLCKKIKAVNSSMSDSIRPVFGTIQYECQKMPTSGTSEHNSRKTNAYALVKDTCLVHFYNQETGKKVEGMLHVACGFISFSLCEMWNLPWNLVKSIPLFWAKHILKNYVEPFRTRVEEAIKPLFRLIVTRTTTNFEYNVIPFSDQHWCFQLNFASVFLALIIITKWLCWDKRQFSSRSRIIRWLCDLLLRLFGCWCVGSACYDWIGNASVNALRQHNEAVTNQVANMIDFTLLDKLKFENGTLTKEAFHSASFRNDAKASKFLNKTFAQFAQSDDASILNREQVENFKQYAKDVKLQTQWSPANTWNWLWSKEFKDGVCDFVNKSMEWVVKNAVLYFWYCFLTKMFAGGFAIFNTLTQGTQNATLQRFAQSTRLLSNSVLDSTQTTLDMALQLSAWLGPVLKLVVWFAVILVSSLALYMAVTTAYAQTTSFLYNVITTTPQWWCAYYYIDGFVFALLKQHYHCVLLHRDSVETRAIVNVENDIETTDKIIADNKQGASCQALNDRIEKFAFLQLCVEYGLLNMPKDPNLYKFFLSFVFEALEMLEADKAKFAGVETITSSKFKNDVCKHAIHRSDVNKSEKLGQFLPDTTFSSKLQTCPYVVKYYLRGDKLSRKLSRPTVFLVDLELRCLPFTMTKEQTEQMDEEVYRVLQESGVVDPHWGYVEYLQCLLDLFHELKQINATENVDNNLLWSNFGQYWIKRVEELSCILNA